MVLMAFSVILMLVSGTVLVKSYRATAYFILNFLINVVNWGWVTLLKRVTHSAVDVR